MPDLHVSLPAKLTEVRNLSAAVEEFGDANQLPLPTVFVINLALDELITNAVTHGTFDVPDPAIDIHLIAESSGTDQYEPWTTTRSPFDPAPAFDRGRPRTRHRPWMTGRWTASACIWS